MAYEETPSAKPSKAEKEKLLEKAKRCFKQALDAEAKQRERERDDLRFQVPEYQWDENARRQRMGGLADGSFTPPRPCLSIPKLDQPIQLVLNQERAAHLGVNIHPLSEDADDDTAEIIQGLYRRIERDSQAHVARSWAFTRAVECGRGAYRVNTRYDEEGGFPFDQEITIERILHQESVHFDPAATKPDFSDGEWAFVESWVRLEDFKRQFPKANESSGDQHAFADEVFADPEWTQAGEEKAVRVAEYFYKEHETVTISLMGDGTVIEGAVAEGAEVIATREMDRVSLKWCKHTGSEILEGPQDWNGKHIPLIPVIGRELQPFDDERRWVGLIGPAKDAQRLYNYAASSAVELAALEPKAPWIIAEGQDEGWEEEWKSLNVRNLPVVHYKPTNLQGQPVAPPARVQVDVSRLGPSMALLQEADNFIQAATATYDPSLGRLNQKERSGRAILALQDQADAGNSHFLHNLADISMTYEARVVLDLIPAIYDRPGRIARTLDLEDESQTVMLNQPFYTHPQTQRPVAAPDGKAPAGMKNAAVKTFDLRKGVYSVDVSIGKSYQTRLQQGAEEIGEILTAHPELMPLIGPTYFEFRDFPGSKEIAEILRKVRDKQFPNLESDAQGPTPEQAKAAIDGMQQQLQLVTAQLQQAMEAIKTDQAKQQATLAKAEMDNATKERIAAMESQNRVTLQEMKQMFESTMTAFTHAHEKKSAEFQAAHEVATDAAKADSAATIKAMDLTFRGANEAQLGQEDEI